MTYELCKKLAEIQRRTGVIRLTADMLDVYFANRRITAEQYQELLGMI